MSLPAFNPSTDVPPTSTIPGSVYVQGLMTLGGGHIALPVGLGHIPAIKVPRFNLIPKSINSNSTFLGP